MFQNRMQLKDVSIKGAEDQDAKFKISLEVKVGSDSAALMMNEALPFLDKTVIASITDVQKELPFPEVCPICKGKIYMGQMIWDGAHFSCIEKKQTMFLHI